jgi:undecaprenyl-diphosphatase
LVEILPISAFGHFEILKEVMVDSSDAIKMIMRFSCIGTVLAIGIFYRKDIKKLCAKSRRGELVWLLLMGLPSAVLFCLLEGKFPEFFYKLIVVGGALLIMSLLALNFVKVTKLAQKKAKKKAQLNNFNAVISGLLGSISILPGFSRVAILMMAARLYDEKRERATKIAVLAGVPVLFAMVGKCLCYGGVDFLKMNPGPVAFGILIAFAMSTLALHWAKKIEKKHDLLRVFGWYQLVFALVILIFELIK